MGRILVLLFVVWCGNLFGQLDTVRVYDGLQISYLRRGDTIMVSNRKWGDIIQVLRSKEEEIQMFDFMSNRYRKLVNVSDSLYIEQVKITDMYKSRADIWKDANTDCVTKFNSMVILHGECKEEIVRERRKGVWNGVLYGVLGGFVTGVITSLILAR